MPAATNKIPILWIVATAIVCIVVTRGITLQSHSTNKETLLAFKRVDGSLTDAKKVLTYSNLLISATMKRNSKKLEFAAKIAIWLPKIDSAIDFANKMVDQIETLKDELKMEAGLVIENNREIYNEDDPFAVKKLMFKKGKGEKLKNSLTAFEKNLLGLLPEEKRSKLKKLAVQNLLQQTQVEDKNNWTDLWFKNIPTITALTLLNKFQSDVLSSANLMAEFCESYVPRYSDGFTSYEILATQNSTYLLPGQILEIKAGIGAFSSASRPVIIINGIKKEVNDSGFARYSITVSDKAKNIPVKALFRNPDTGDSVTRTTQITYKVAPPE